MPRGKAKKLLSQSLHDDWLEGKSCRFKGGDVIRRKVGVDKSLGVIQFALHEMETYHVKWYVGPKPWDYIEGPVFSAHIEKTNEPNPLKYKWSERVPGPSSDEIDRLEAVFAKKAKREFTAREADLHAALLEEEISKKKSLKVDETKVDSIVDETLGEDTEVPVENLSVAQKLKVILDEE